MGHDQCPLITDALIGELSTNLSPSHIANRLGQAMILHHPGHMEIFDDDRLVGLDDLRGESMGNVVPQASDATMQPRQTQTSFLLPLTALTTAGVLAIETAQPPEMKP
jgi:hypothetical protein